MKAEFFQFLEARNDRGDYKKANHWASDLGKCKRQLLYNWQNVEPDSRPTPSNLIKFYYGELTEVMVKDWLDWMIETETQLDGHIVTGYEEQDKKHVAIEGLQEQLSVNCDFIVHRKGAEDVGIEVKSTFGRGTRDIMKSQRAKDSYLLQVLAYLVSYDVAGVYHPYFSRDDGILTYFRCFMKDGCLHSQSEWGDVVKYEEYTEDYLKTFFADVEKILDDGEAPREYTAAIRDGEVIRSFEAQKTTYKSDWQCLWCSYPKRCWADVIRKCNANPGSKFYGNRRMA